MHTQSWRIPDELADRLERLAKSTRRAKTSFLLEALERYLDEREDLEVALALARSFLEGSRRAGLNDQGGGHTLLIGPPGWPGVPCG